MKIVTSYKPLEECGESSCTNPTDHYFLIKDGCYKSTLWRYCDKCFHSALGSFRGCVMRYPHTRISKTEIDILDIIE